MGGVGLAYELGGDVKGPIWAWPRLFFFDLLKETVLSSNTFTVIK